MYRQYIGARYVPKFYENSQNPLSNEWEANVTYEALTVVTYLSDTYTAKKPVPITIGNPRDNAEYWSLTGQFNAQVEEYRQEAVEAAEKADSVDSKVGNLDDLMTIDKTSVVNAINEIETRIPSTSAKRYVFLSDSYGNNHDGTNYVAEFKALNNIANDNIYNIAEGTSGYQRVGTNGHTLYTLLQSQYSNISNPETITDVIITAGLNDALTDLTGEENAIIQTLEYAKTCFPNATIHVGFIGASELFNSTQIMAMITIKSLLKKCCGKLGCKWILNSEYPMHNRKYQYDDVHPNAEGSKFLAYFINEHLIGGNSDYSDYSNEATFSIGSNTHHITEIFNNGETELVIPDFIIPANTQISAAQWTDIATVTGGIVKGSGGFQSSPIIWRSGTSITAGQIAMRLYGGKLQLFSLTGSAVQPSVNITVISQSYRFNTMYA